MGRDATSLLQGRYGVALDEGKLVICADCRQERLREAIRNAIEALKEAHDEESRCRDGFSEPAIGREIRPQSASGTPVVGDDQHVCFDIGGSLDSATVASGSAAPSCPQDSERAMLADQWCAFYVIAWRITKRAEDVESVLQEASARAIAAAGTFEPGRHFGPWFYRIVRHAAIDVFRARARDSRTRAGDALITNALAAPLPDEVSPEIGAAFDELLRVACLCGALPHRTIASLLVGHGLYPPKRVIRWMSTTSLFELKLRALSIAGPSSQALDIRNHLRVGDTFMGELNEGPPSTSADMRIGETCLQDYGVSTRLSRWKDRFTTRLARAIADAADACRHCQLRNLVPCSPPENRRPPSSVLRQWLAERGTVPRLARCDISFTRSSAPAKHLEVLLGDTAQQRDKLCSLRIQVRERIATMADGAADQSELARIVYLAARGEEDPGFSDRQREQYCRLKLELEEVHGLARCVERLHRLGIEAPAARTAVDAMLELDRVYNANLEALGLRDLSEVESVPVEARICMEVVPHDPQYMYLLAVEQPVGVGQARVMRLAPTGDRILERKEWYLGGLAFGGRRRVVTLILLGHRLPVTCDLAPWRSLVRIYGLPTLPEGRVGYVVGTRGGRLFRRNSDGDADVSSECNMGFLRRLKDLRDIWPLIHTISFWQGAT